jgi:hypothetical protein
VYLRFVNPEQVEYAEAMATRTTMGCPDALNTPDCESPMYYKEDWPQARRRLEAFWQNEIIDRCCVAVYAPRKTSKLPPFPELQWGPWPGGLTEIPDFDQEAITRWWTDPEQNYRRLETWFENTYFGGEAVPATYVDWGAMALAACFGSPPRFTKTTVWYPAVIDDLEAWRWQFDPETNPYWRGILAIQRYLIDHNRGRYFLGKPELGNAADVLSLMRGMDRLALDLIDHPGAVLDAVAALSAAWVDRMEQVYRLNRAANDGGDVLAWMSLWAPGRHDQIACDYSSVISPAQFRRFFVPDIRRMGRWCEYGTYHLDGPAAMRNMLDTLLGLEEIDAIEFTSGAGAPPTYSPHYIPAYQRIQRAGKRLYLLVEPHEIEPLLEALSPRGLFLCTHTTGEEDADALLKQVARLSKGRR